MRHIRLYISETLWRQAKAKAALEDRPLSALMTEALTSYVRGEPAAAPEAPVSPSTNEDGQ